MGALGSVPEVQGTGLRLFSGIFSLVDLSGNNIFTATSSNIVFGNSTDNPIISFQGAVVTQMTISSGATAATSFLQPVSDQTLYSLLGRNQAGPGVQGRWDSATGNRFLSVGMYDNVGVFTEALRVNNSGVTISTLAQAITGSSFVSAWPSGTPGGIFTAPTVPFALYLVTVTIAGSNDPGNYNTVGLFSVNGNAARLTILQQGTLMTMSVSGLTVLFTQGNGSTANVSSWWTKLI